MTDKRPVTITIPGELVSNVRIAIEARAKEFKVNIDNVKWSDSLTTKHWSDMARGLTRLAEKLK